MKTKIPDYPTKTMGFIFARVSSNCSKNLTSNIDVTDGRTKGAECVMENIDYRVENSTRPSIIWVSFPHPDMKPAQRKYTFIPNNSTVDRNWTPVLEVTRQF